MHALLHSKLPPDCSAGDLDDRRLDPAGSLSFLGQRLCEKTDQPGINLRSGTNPRSIREVVLGGQATLPLCRRPASTMPSASSWPRRPSRGAAWACAAAGSRAAAATANPPTPPARPSSRSTATPWTTTSTTGGLILTLPRTLTQQQARIP